MLQPHIGPTLSAITLILYVCAKMYVYTYVSQGERVKPQSPYNVYRLSSILIYSSYLYTYSHAAPTPTTPWPSPPLSGLHGERFPFRRAGGFTFPGPGVMLPQFRRPQSIPQIRFPRAFLFAARGIEMPSGT